MESFGRQFRFLFDTSVGLPNHLLSRWIFLRAMGLVYFSAFIAFLFQVRGLIGTRGILPAAEYLDHIRPLGLLRLWYAPTLLWISSSNSSLIFLCSLGLLASLMLLTDLMPRFALSACFVSFLSIMAVAQDFGQYQSDGMLLEAGFLSIFVAPAGMRPGLGRASLAPRAAWFLLLWEWFRIYFESGVVKLASGDPTWRNLTAMYEYYQNSPLPTWLGWYMQHLPYWFHRASAGLTLVVELVLVWMAFLPGRWRLACFVIVTIWQIGVIATANYAFLNYLVLILAFLLLGDQTISLLVPRRWRSKLVLSPSALEAKSLDQRQRFRPDRIVQKPLSFNALWRFAALARVAIASIALLWIGYDTTAELILMLWPSVPLPGTPIVALEPFRIANEYGLFANMTPHRYEIEFQGSNDGITWRAYPFRFKPQDPQDRPSIYAPYQPRFDWNLWFASLGNWQQYPIVPLTQERLLHNDKDVLSLFGDNPFPKQPPVMVRTVLWQYWFSTSEQKKDKHVWWTRHLKGAYSPTLKQSASGSYTVERAGEISYYGLP